MVSIKELHPKMLNVTIEGVVERKTEISPMKEKKGKYFACYIRDGDEEKSVIRITGFNQCAEKFHSLLDNGKSVKITKISTNINEYRGMTELQGILSPESIVTVINKEYNFQKVFTEIKDLKVNTKPNVLGVIVSIEERERILQSGVVKQVKVVTLKDKSAQVTVTFWEQLEKIATCNPADILELENCTVSKFKEALSLNVNAGTVVNINVTHEKGINLIDSINPEDSIINISMASNVDTLNVVPKAVIIDQIKKDINKVEEQESELKIKKIRLINELKLYENE